MGKEGPSIKGMFDLSGQVAMVTGAAQWIGWEIAEAYAELGAKIVITSREGDKAQIAAAELDERFGIEAMGLALEVRDPRSVAEAFDRAAQRFGRLDILVNNAGGAPKSDKYHLWERRLEDWTYVIETNLTGAFLCTQAAAKIMMPAQRGSIVNVASIAGLVGRDRSMYEGLPMRPNLVDYAACKAGVLGFTRDAAAELAPYHIRVNAISPGGIERGQPPEFVRRYSQATALGRMGEEGHELKGAAVLLASDAGRYMTGQNIVVDGGFAMYK